MDHHLENLGPERFQQLCQALLVKEFPGVTCLPVAQPDGGRDALRHLGEPQSGSSPRTKSSSRRTPLPGDEARRWVLDMADGEIEKVRRLIERGASQDPLVTNVVGTAHLDAGSIDRLHAELTLKLGVPAQCWWRYDVNRRLDGSWNGQLRYPEGALRPGFPTAPARLHGGPGAGAAAARRLCVPRGPYAEDVEVKFKQVELHNKLLDLFVDLPFRLILRSDEARARDLAASFPSRLHLLLSFETGTYALEDVAAEGGGTATLLLGNFAPDKLGQVVVEGAPVWVRAN